MAIDFFFEKALAVMKRMGYRDAMMVYSSIGLSYLAMGQFQKAITSQNQALLIALALDNKVREGMVYNRLGKHQDFHG